MNIIIVAKPFSTPKVLRLGDWRSYALIGTAVAVVLGLTFASGTLFGAVVGAPNEMRVELDKAHTQLTAQGAELVAVRESVARDMDALALRLGQLQAEATRLNALGERLAKLGKLDDGEFNFREPPAMGGPKPRAQLGSLRPGDISKSLDRLQEQLDRQSQQLAMLDDVLLDRKLDQSLMPTGMPVRVGYASSHYGNRADPFTGSPDFHPGVDFNGPHGSDILAVGGGVVSFAGRKPGYGNAVEVDHGNGYLTRYAHNDRNSVQVGDAVKAGDVIAKMGRTGRATGVHVHFEVWLNGRLVNPSVYIRAIRG